MSTEIRIAEPADAPQIAKFQIAMAMETESKTLNPKTVETAVEKVFQDPGKGFYVVVSCEGATVGSLMITFEWSDWRDTNIWYIQSVFIEPEYRGQKLFSRMFATVQKLAVEKGVKHIRLYVEQDNNHAQQVYESLGMKRLPYYMYDIATEEIEKPKKTASPN